MGVIFVGLIIDYLFIFNYFIFYILRSYIDILIIMKVKKVKNNKFNITICGNER